ncbi:hypothetical protein JCM3770_005003 [Rhodotorula araucariae]
MGDQQEHEATQAALRELLALRERLTRDAKGAKGANRDAKGDGAVAAYGLQPLDYDAAFSLILPFATSVRKVVASATGKDAKAPVPTTSAFEALDFLLLRAKAVVAAGAYPDELPLVRAQFSLPFLQSLASIIYTTWENQLVSAQQRLKSSISTLLAIAAPDLLNYPQIAQSLQASVLADAYDSKRGLQVLEVLLMYGVVEDFAAFAAAPARGEEEGDVREGVIRRFLTAMVQHEEMAAVIGRVTMAWVEKCWASVPSDDETWWIRPCIAACRRGDARIRHTVATYILGGIFAKRKATFKEILRVGGYTLSDETGVAGMDEQDLETAVAILKAGNALNLVELDAAASATPVKGVAKVALPSALLAACLHHSSTSLRTSALSLLVLTPSSSTLFPLSSFPLLRAFYAYSLGEEDGDFRMSTVSSTGKLFLRLRDSSWRAHRTVAKGKDGAAAAQEYLAAAQAFVAWFLDLVGRDNLNPARPYRVKMNALRMLDLALKARVDPRYRVDELAPEVSAVTGKDATSGYSTYRQGSKTQTPSFQAKHRQIQQRNDSRPSTPSPDSSPAPVDESGWPFAVDLVNAATTQTLLRQLLSTYTALRFLVIATLERFPAPLPGYEGSAGAEKAKCELLLPALRMIRSGREAEASAGAGIIGLVWRKWVLESLEAGVAPAFTLGEVGGWQEGAETRSGPPGFAFIASLLDLIEQQLSHYRADLAQAAAVAPMHGTLLALRHLFISIPLRAYDALSSLDDRRALFHRAFAVVQRVWDVTAPVLAAKAPEGGAAEEADNEEARAIRFEREVAAQEEGDDEDVAEGTGGPQHKIILSACWRAMKEAGELLETILRLPSELDTESFRQVWSLDEIRAIGELFGTWLRLARHRGTVANLHPCYTRSAGALIAAGKNWPEVGRLPEEWLNKHLDDIVSAQISITRRSAALPFIILGLLLTIRPSSRPTFDAAFTRLFEIAESTSADITDSSRVHAMNTIRTVFLDAKGGVAAAGYVERGFLISISLFWSPNWICRNVALLLFATLIGRAFNARRTNLDRDPVSLAKRLTIDDFFVRYPSLEKVLREEIERGWRESQEAQPSSNLHSPLFSILMLFSLLQTPRRVDMPSARSKASAFVPIIKACARSRVWKIRDAAGDALTGLVAPGDVGETARELLAGVESDMESLSANELHGRLVQVQRLLEANVILAGEEEEQVSALYLRLVPSILPPAATTSEPLRPRVPYAVLSAFLLIALRLPSTFSTPGSHLAPLALSYLSQAESWAPEAYHLPSAEEFLRSAWRVLFASSTSPPEQLALAKAGLQARSIEVQRAALSALERLGAVAHSVADLLSRVVQDARYAGDVRIAAAELLRALPPRGRAGTGEFGALARLHADTPVVPLREAVLPVLAGAACSEAEQDAVLTILHAASDPNESVESREAASLALVALSSHAGRAAPNVAAALVPRAQHLVARLLQDDDPVVRSHAHTALSARAGVETRLVEAKAVERAVCDGGEACVRALEAEERAAFERDLATLANPTSLLFAVEKPNIYRDVLLCSAGVGASASPDEARVALARLVDAALGLDAGPLGMGGNELVSRWARVWVQRLEAAVGTRGDEDEGAAETVTRTAKVLSRLRGCV